MVMGVTGRRRVLAIVPDEGAAAELRHAFAGMGVDATFAADAVAGWRTFARVRPEVVISALHTASEGAAWFIRRLHTEYMGAMPSVYVIAAAEDIELGLRALEPDAYLVPPISLHALASLCGAVAEIGDTAMRQAARLRELYEISSLGGDYLNALDLMVSRAALTFGVSDCVLWGPAHEPYWPRTARALAGPEDEASLLWRCDIALTAGTTVMFAPPGEAESAWLVDAPGSSYLSASLDSPLGGAEIGALCLVDDGCKRFSGDERDALRVLARRLSTEMAWVAAHNRLVEEHERLRETSLLDPMLGVWTRGALEKSLAGEIEQAHRRGEPLAVAIADVDQLRQINDRYGHAAGDAALAHIADVVRGALRTQDILGRYGGDELAIVMTSSDLHAARDVLTGVVDALRAAPLLHHGIEIGLGLAVGATSIAPEEHSGEQAFLRALAALRRARRQRAPLVIVDPTAQSQSAEFEAIDPFGGDGDVLPPGSTLGGMYRVLHEISRGAMGVVYRGEDLGLGRQVAIKVLRSDLAMDDDLVAKFREEAALLASIQHPHLVQIYSLGTHGDDVFFVMELVEGEPLTDVLRAAAHDGEPLGGAAIAKVIEEVAGALDAMHEVGVIHRDVKPANILLDRIRNRAVLVDVGVAKRHEDATDAAGTPGFAAPESFLDASEGPSTDVYGLASTTYMMLTGVAPFGSGEVEKVVKRQLYQKPALPSELRGDLSRELDRVLLRALHAEQHERYPAASAFARALREVLTDGADDDAPEERTTPDGLDGRWAADADSARFEPRPTPPGTLRRTPLSTSRRNAPLSRPDLDRPSRIGHTRGAVFRVAYRLLGNRLGTNWVPRITQGDDGLAAVLDPTLAPMSWQPVDHLITLLIRSMAIVSDPGMLARAIGRATMSATLARFFGADPASLPPMKVLGAAESYWSRYHTWGKLRVAGDGATGARITLDNSPGEPLLCAVVEGSLGRIAELAGAAAVETRHPECRAGNHQRCVFTVSWTEPARTPAGPGRRAASNRPVR